MAVRLKSPAAQPVVATLPPKQGSKERQPWQFGETRPQSSPSLPHFHLNKGLKQTRRKPPMGSVHQPVLVDEVVAWLAPREGSIIVDGTVGGGGHAVALARRVGPGGRVIGLDRDPAMLALAERRSAACR